MATTYGFIIFSCSFIIWIGHIGFTFPPRGYFLLQAKSRVALENIQENATLAVYQGPIYLQRDIEHPQPAISQEIMVTNGLFQSKRFQ